MVQYLYCIQSPGTLQKQLRTFFNLPGVNSAMRSANVYKQSSDVKGTCVQMAVNVVLLESVQAGGFCAPVFQRL